MTTPQAHAYWLNPSRENTPATYLDAHEGRSNLVADLADATVPKTARILELGCNAGANLATLHARGFTNLEGVDINPDAVNLLRATFPELADTPIHVKSIEDFVAHMGDYDLIFTLAVLEHLPGGSEFVFEGLAGCCRWLLTVEDEASRSSRHFPRNYRDVFTALGMTQTVEMHGLDDVGLDANFVARLFVWPEAA